MHASLPDTAADVSDPARAASGPSDAERSFLQHLPVIDRAAAAIARRHGFTPDDTAEVTSWVRLRFIENDYAAIRKFRGESSLGTYLTVVVAMLVRDYRVQRWGRWRPSAAARRLGDVAVRLETLVRRNGQAVHEAAETLRTAGLTSQSDRELATLLQQLPDRDPLRPVNAGADPLLHVAEAASADTALAQRHREDERAAARKSLEEALQRLTLEDRVILRLRFWEDTSVADIARGLGLDQKKLYRRLERLLSDLRHSLTAAGLNPAQVQALFDEVD